MNEQGKPELLQIFKKTILLQFIESSMIKLFEMKIGIKTIEEY